MGSSVPVRRMSAVSPEAEADVVVSDARARDDPPRVILASCATRAHAGARAGMEVEGRRVRRVAARRRERIELERRGKEIVEMDQQ